MKTDEDETCPRCGSDVMFFYGLAGGGIGTYVICKNEECSHFEKQQDVLEGHET